MHEPGCCKQSGAPRAGTGCRALSGQACPGPGLRRREPPPCPFYPASTAAHTSGLVNGGMHNLAHLLRPAPIAQQMKSNHSMGLITCRALAAIMSSFSCRKDNAELTGLKGEITLPQATGMHRVRHSTTVAFSPARCGRLCFLASLLCCRGLPRQRNRAQGAPMLRALGQRWFAG